MPAARLSLFSTSVFTGLVMLTCGARLLPVGSREMHSRVGSLASGQSNDWRRTVAWASASEPSGKVPWTVMVSIRAEPTVILCARMLLKHVRYDGPIRSFFRGWTSSGSPTKVRTSTFAGGAPTSDAAARTQRVKYTCTTAPLGG